MTAKKTAPTPDKSDPIYEELRIVRDRVQEVLGVLTYIARDPEMVARQEEAMRAFFGRGRRRADVYLALSGDRNITQVGSVLKMQRQNVSREIQALRGVQLIMPMTAGGRGDVWIRNPTLESTLRLSEKVRRWFPSSNAVAATPEESAERSAQPDVASGGGHE